MHYIKLYHNIPFSMSNHHHIMPVINLETVFASSVKLSFIAWLQLPFKKQPGFWLQILPVCFWPANKRKNRKICGNDFFQRP